MAYLSVTLLMFTGIFLILLVLVQRGRGGGLAGAFGGMGGQSAFGTKAGDVFTRITVIVAVLWVLLAGASIHALRSDDKFKAPAAAPGMRSEDDDKIPTADGSDPDAGLFNEAIGTDPPKSDPKTTDGAASEQDTAPKTPESDQTGPELPKLDNNAAPDEKPEATDN